MRKRGTENRKRRMRIGIFQDAFFPMIDGVIQVVDYYARELQRYADVTVVVPEVPGQPFDDAKLPYRVLRCRAVRVPVLDYCLPMPLLDPAFLRELGRMRFDIVHIHSPFTLGLLGVHYAKLRGVPVIGTMHSQFRRDFQRAVKSRVLAQLLTRILIGTFRRCDECWAVNGAMARLYHEEYGYPSWPRVMRNATDMRPVGELEEASRRAAGDAAVGANAATDAHAAEEARHLAEQMFGLAPDEFVMLFVGRLNDLKNVFLIARSLGIVKKRMEEERAKAERAKEECAKEECAKTSAGIGHGKDAPISGMKFRMLFIGTGQDEAKLRAQIRKSGVEKETVFAGRVADRGLLAAAYARADLFLFPSLYDASSLVQIEAASQGTPALYVQGAVTADTVTVWDPAASKASGEPTGSIISANGFIAENDPNAYAEAILAIMRDPEMLRQVGENARRDLYVTWESVAAEVYKRYLSVRKKRRP